MNKMLDFFRKGNEKTAGLRKNCVRRCWRNEIWGYRSWGLRRRLRFTEEISRLPIKTTNSSTTSKTKSIPIENIHQKQNNSFCYSRHFYTVIFILLHYPVTTPNCHIQLEEKLVTSMNSILKEILLIALLITTKYCRWTIVENKSICRSSMIFDLFCCSQKTDDSKFEFQSRRKIDRKDQ